MRLEVIRAGEGSCLATLDPACIQTVLVLLVHGLLMPLFVFLALEALLLAGLLVDAVRITASKLVLRDDDLTVNARLAGHGFCAVCSAKVALAVMPPRQPLSSSASVEFWANGSPLGFIIFVIRLMLRRYNRS